MKQLTIDINNYEEYIIDFVEHTLSEDLNDQMISFLNLHPTIAEEVMSFRNIKLVPDTSIHYPEVEGLLKKEPIRRLLWTRLMVAASIAILAAAWVLLRDTTINIHEAEQNLVEHKIESKIKVQDRIEVKSDQREISNSHKHDYAEVVPQQEVSKEVLDLKEQVGGTQRSIELGGVKQVAPEVYGPTQNVIKEKSEYKEIKKGKVSESNQQLMAAVDFLPTIGPDLLDDAGIRASDYDIVFTVVMPNKQKRVNLIKSKVTGTFAFANTSMAFLPTFINSKRNLDNN